MPRVTYLLGAGASIPAGVPLAVELGSMLGEGPEPPRHYLHDFGIPWPVYRDAIAFAREFLMTARGNEKERSSAVDVEQIIDFAAEIDIALAQPDDKLIRRAFDPALADALQEFQVAHRENPNVFAGVRSRAIADVAQLTTLKHDADVTYLYPMLEDQDANTIVTLNYDLAVERAAADAGVRVDTGFDIWATTGLLDFDNHAKKLLKVHGSNSWLVTVSGGMARDGGSLTEEWLPDVPKHRSLDWWEQEGGSARRWRGLIVGGVNKLTATGPYLQLMAEFSRALSQTDKLVVVGYSFRDSHINQLITAFANARPSARMVVVDPSVKQIANRFLEIWPTKAEPNVWVIDDGVSDLRRAQWDVPGVDVADLDDD